MIIPRNTEKMVTQRLGCVDKIALYKKPAAQSYLFIKDTLTY